MRTAIAIPFLILLLGGVAFARAPTREELPTVRDILRRADEEQEAARKAAEAAARDDKMEKIRAWEEGKVPVGDVKFLLDLVKDEKEERKYRYQATVALRNRLKDVPNDARFKKLKQQVGMELVGLLTDNEEEIRVWVAEVFRTFWQGEYSRIGYDPKEASYLKRLKGAREWRKFLTTSR